MNLRQIAKLVSIYSKEGNRMMIAKLYTYATGTCKRWIFKSIYSVTGVSLLRMRTPAGPITFRTDPSWGKWRRIASGQVYEPGLLTKLHQSLDSSDILYNVGSRWGIISLFARRCGVHDSQIHNFESDAEAVAILRRNVPHTVINHVAVGRGNGANELSLDGYTKSLPTPSVIKIDVEGGGDASH